MTTDLQDKPAHTAARRLALVLNDKAGALLAGGDHADQLRARLEQAGVTLQEVADGTLPDRIEAAAASGADAIVVAGGDGTVACACQVVAGKNLTLGVVPAGTMNLLAKDLRLPIDDVKASADLLAAGTTRLIDAGQVGDTIFACACMLGAPARIGHHREVGRHRGNGLFAWLHVARAAWRALRRNRAHRLILRVDGTAHRVKTLSLTITVNALDDASGHAFGRTVLDGGTLCAYVVRRHSFWNLLRAAVRMTTGASKDPAVKRLDGSIIEVDSKYAAALRILIDGEEHLLPPPLRFTVRPRALRMIAPAP
jgi:diacylglycerol kinase family enzyme